MITSVEGFFFFGLAVMMSLTLKVHDSCHIKTFLLSQMPRLHYV